LEAREVGKVRYLGFSAHTTKGALAALNGFRFDTVMFPINFIEFFQMGFGKAVLEKTREQGTAVCGGAWPSGAQHERRWWYRPLEDELQIDMALRFTLSQEGVVAGLPPSSLELTARAVEIGRSHRPIAEDEITRLPAVARECLSLFRDEEERVAFERRMDKPTYPDSPYECGMHANV
jgi:predicted aldo/keto reductase-like oxidoreductase